MYVRIIATAKAVSLVLNTFKNSKLESLGKKKVCYLCLKQKISFFFFEAKQHIDALIGHWRNRRIAHAGAGESFVFLFLFFKF